MSKPSERSLALVMIAWLKTNGWSVYEEVKYRADSASTSIWIADIVATKDGIVAVFEVKAAFGLPVMAQAERWEDVANQVHVVVPGDGTAANHGHAYGYRQLHKAGIGVLHIRDFTKLEKQAALRPGGALPPPEALVSVVVEAVPSNVFTGPLEAALHPEHQTGEFAGAGSKNGDRVSKTNLTHKTIRDYLEANGGSLTVERVAHLVGVGERTLVEWADDEKIARVRLNGVSAGPMRLEIVESGNETPLRTASKILPRYIPK